ncbi:MAG: lactate dehydrogenase [Bacteroidetes bacterium]|nr:lactate dehydrogenase [Bacteroidota bacterium]
MRIIAFDTRFDELVHFDKIKQCLNLDVVYTEDAITKENIHLTEGAYGISVLAYTLIDKEIIDTLRNNGVRHISTRTIGMNHINVAYAEQQGMIVTNSSYKPDGVAEFTLMMMLLSLRKYKAAMFRGNVNDYSLIGLDGKEVKGSTVGVIGTGSIGAAVIRLLSSFGCKILAYSPTGRIKPELQQYAEFVDLDTIFVNSDIITLHVPLMEATTHIINKEALVKMKPGVTLVNCSRGELMEIDALIEGIEAKKIGALALDVFEDEAGIYHQDRRTDIIANRNMAYLRQFPNVVMTQHMAFFTDNSIESMVRCSLESFVKGNVL